MVADFMSGPMTPPGGGREERKPLIDTRIARSSSTSSVSRRGLSLGDLPPDWRESSTGSARFRHLSVSITTSVRVMNYVKLEPVRGVSWWVSALILTNVILGVGLLNFPRSFIEGGGLAWALPAQMVITVFILIGMLMLGHCTENSGRGTMQDVIQHYTGSIGLVICNSFILVHNFGTCITLLVIIADQFDDVMQTSFGSTFCSYWFLDRTYTLPVISLIVVLPLCYANNIGDFSCTSFVGVLTIGYLMFIAVYYYYYPAQGQTPYKALDDRNDTTKNDCLKLFKLVPTLCFSFEAHVEAVPMYHTVREPKLRSYTLAVAAAVLLASLVYTVIGVFGVFSFGANVATDLLTNYSSAQPLVIAAMAMLAIKAVMTYPIVLFCARLVVDDLVVACTMDRWSERRRRYVSTTLLFIASLMVAVFVPSIGSVISLLGFSGAMFVFIFPGVCYVVEYSIWGSGKDISSCLLGCIFLVVGAMVAGISTSQSFIRILSGEFSQREVSCKTH